MSALGSLVVSLNANIAQFEAAMNRSAYLADRNMKAVQRSVESVQNTLQGLAGIVAGVFAFEGIKSFVDSMIEVGAVTEKLTASMTAMGGIYGVSSGSLKHVAEEMQALGVSAGEAAGGINSFLKYGIEITKLPRLVAMAKDLSAIDNEGRNTREMFGLLVNAIGRGPRALMQLRLGSGEEFKAMSKDIKETTNEAFLSMPQRAGLAFELLEKATRDFAGVSSSTMDTYKAKQNQATLAAEEFRVALFNLAKPVLSAVVQQQISSWQGFTAALQNNQVAITQAGETLAIFVGRISNSIGTVVSFVATHKAWAEALLGLYGMSRLGAIIMGVTATIFGALAAIQKFIVGLTTMKGLVAGPWPTIVIAVTAVGIAAGITSLRKLTEEFLAARGIINRNEMERPRTHAGVEAVLSPEGTKNTVQQHQEILDNARKQEEIARNMNSLAENRISLLEQQLQITSKGTASDRLAQLEAIRAARQRQEQLKTTMPLGGGKGGGGKGADASGERMIAIIDNLNKEISKLSEGSIAEIDAWAVKAVNDIEKVGKKGAEVQEALALVSKATALKKQKVEEEFRVFVGKESGNIYLEIEAQAKEWLTKYKGIKGAEEAITDIANRKRWETDVKYYSEKLSFEKSLYDEAVNVLPGIQSQNIAKLKALDLEIEINRWVQATKLAEMERAGIINRAQADEYRAFQGLIDQQKKFNLQAEQNKGLTGWAYGRSKEADQRSSIKDLMGSAESFIGNAFSSGIQGVLSKEKTNLKEIGKTMFQGFLGEIHKGSITKSFDALAKIISPAGGKGKGEGPGSLAGAGEILNSAGLQLITSAGGLALSGIGIMTNSQALVMAGTVLQMAGLAIQVYQSLTATTQMTAAVALTTSAGALSAAASMLMMAAATDIIPFFHSGGVVYAHGGWPLKSDEVPIIAQTGERVLSRRQNRDYEAGMRAGGGGGGQVVKYVTNKQEITIKGLPTTQEVNRLTRRFRAANDYEDRRRGY